VKVPAAKVSAGEVRVAAAPAAAAPAEADAMPTAMSASVPATMSTTMAAATSAGGRKRWGESECSADGCGGGDSDHGLSRHGGVILSGHPSTRTRS
jgi:N-methylhydantoinase B/oxoprolinase/acetone carboxylase alpha subunit